MRLLQFLKPLKLSQHISTGVVKFIFLCIGLLKWCFFIMFALQFK